MAVRTRDSMGRWIGPCRYVPPTDPADIEREKLLLEEFKDSVTFEEWKELIMVTIKEAREGDGEERNRARKWLAKYFVGEPTQVHQLLYKEDNELEIVVKLDEDEEENEWGGQR